MVNKKGMALITVLIILTLLLTLGIALLEYTNGDLIKANADKRNLVAFYAAKSGIKFASTLLAEGQDLTSEEFTGPLDSQDARYTASFKISAIKLEYTNYMVSSIGIADYDPELEKIVKFRTKVIKAKMTPSGDVLKMYY